MLRSAARARARLMVAGSGRTCRDSAIGDGIRVGVPAALAWALAGLGVWAGLRAVPASWQDLQQVTVCHCPLACGMDLPPPQAVRDRVLRA